VVFPEVFLNKRCEVVRAKFEHWAAQRFRDVFVHMFIVKQPTTSLDLLAWRPVAASAVSKRYQGLSEAFRKRHQVLSEAVCKTNDAKVALSANTPRRSLNVAWRHACAAQ